MKTKSCFITPLITSIILLCAAWTSTVTAATPYIFVNGRCGNDAWSGKYSQCSAPDGYKRTIQAALDAIPNGGVVAVIDGIYAGDGNRDLNFKGKAVKLVCANGPDACTIDCGGARTENHRAFHFHTGEDSNSIVQGFTVANGVAYKGGAVLCSNSSPKFVNCIFRDNEATDDDTGGGAMYNENCSPTLESCTFTENQAMPSASYGGGITNERSSPTLTDCTFSNNHAWGGGGIYNTDNSNPVLGNCSFLNNQAARGAGMGNAQSSPTLSRCTFTGNSASYYGGAMNNTGNSNPVLTHCTFTANSAIDGGGMANSNSSSPAIINCLFSANSASSYGGAVSNDTSTTVFVNCTLTGNSSPSGGGVASYDYSEVTITNSILWDNTPNQVYNDDPACNQVRYSCVEGGWTGAGNISGNPLFADPDGPDNIPGTEDDDFSIVSGSPCIDAGDNSPVPVSLLTDLIGRGRFADDLAKPDTGSGTPPIIDMGVREFQGLFYVDDTAVGANDGTSWVDAFTSLQDALVAASSGAEIRVAQGFYAPDLGHGITRGDREVTFELFSELTIKGGYAGFGASNPDDRNINDYRTVLTGDLSSNDQTLADPAELLEHASRSENSFHVVTIGQDAQDVALHGFIITGGNANGDYSSGTDSGAGIYKGHYQNSAVIKDCTFIANCAENGGGGMLNGGPVHMDRCRFIGNAAESGGGMENYAGWQDPADLTNCLFSGNFAASDGGAISTQCASVKCTNCTFSVNQAEGTGFYRGGGITGDDDTVMYLTNCIFWGNSDADGMVESSQIDQDSISQTHVNYCCVQGWTGVLGGEGNFGNDPVFLDADGPDNTVGTDDDNLRLSACSPCIDAGDNSAVPPLVTEDLDGNQRIINGAVDRGAYERQDGAPPTGIIYVDDSAAGANTGTSWQDAYLYLQDALAMATSGDEIWVAQGRYRPDQSAYLDGLIEGDREASFRLRTGVTIKGGYAGLPLLNPDYRDIALYSTLLSGDLQGNDTGALDGTEENSLHVVTVTEGQMVIDGFTITSGRGELDQYRGSGIYKTGGHLTVSNCVLIRNWACCGYHGKSIFNGAGKLDIVNCVFDGAGANEGIEGSPSGVETVVNSIFLDHSQAGITKYEKGLTVTNCLFAFNEWGLFLDDGHHVISNTIFWNNGENLVYDGGAEATFTNCFDGENPGFVDNGCRDFHLRADSSCINAGDNAVIEGYTTDLDGNPRIVREVVDIGPYEYSGPRIIYVDDSAAGANNGTSWANAFNYLQDALDIAQNGDEIRIAQGTYKPDQGAGVTPKDRSATFRLKNNVTIKGGYAGVGEPAPDARNIELYHTILSGDLAGDDDAPDNPGDLLAEPTRIDNSYHVVTATGCDRTAVLDGFTITAGNANGPTEAQKWGGGLYAGNPTVKNCIFINNSANTGGGGIHLSGPYYTTAGGLITDCTITHNAASIGGGIYGCCVLFNCAISANAATKYSGGGVHLGQGCDTTVTDCVFSSNSAVTYGGGVSLGVSGSTPIFTRCTFIANSADGSGGGVASDGCTCGTYPEFHSCAFIANSAGRNGGGLYNFGYALAKMYSCLVIGNTAGNNGGGICDGTGYNDGGSLIVNCTITHNTASGQGGGIYYGTNSERGRSIVNSILWYNSDSTGQSGSCSQICATDGTASSIDYCCIQGWTGGGTGNIGKNPLFIDADGADNVPGTQDDNLHLQPDSPCIDKGRSSAVPLDSNDLDGNPRILAGSVDMGAYEFVAVPEWTRYDLIDLGTLGGSRSEARAINNYRQIVGWAVNESGRERATLFDYTGAGNNIDLGTLGGNMSEAYSINIHGDVVGKALADATSYFHAALFDTADPCDNISLEGPANDSSEAHSINDHGQIVGSVRFPNSDWKATLFDPLDPNNNIELSGDLTNRAGSDDSCALSINNSGQIVGYAHTGETSVIDRPYMFDRTGAGNNIRLTLNNSPGVAYCINDAGQIVGSSWQTNGAGLFNPEDPNLNLSLGALPEATGSVAYSINNRGQIVGRVTFEDSIQDSFYNAVIFDPTGSRDNRNLNDLVDNALGWELNVAYGINDAGWIVGYGTNPHGSTRAFLLIPKGQQPALVAHWKLDESEGNTAKDSAGTNDGALHNGPQWQPYGGHLEGALLFDGENDYVNCGSDSVFDITGQITVAAWANFNSVNMEWQTVIAKGDSAWRLSTASNHRRYHFAVTGGPPWNYINGDIEVEAHEWHHVCGTYDGANLRLYIDGVEDPAGPVPELNGVTTDDYDVYIGENQERPGRYWDGLIDDVRVYNYALAPAQVFNLCKPGVLYVDADAPGANNGSSWADAFKCLQDALDAAANGTEIRVAQGTYRPDRGAGITPGDRQATFQLVNGVAIKGGYAGFGTPHPDARDIEVYETILSGDIAGNDVDVNDPEKLGWEPTRSENSCRVITGSQTDATAIIDGFSITGGYANYDDFSQCNGAGMFNVHGSPTVLNCTFIANFAGNGDGGGLGGAMYNYHGSPTLTNCRFIYNASIALDGGEGAGGAMGNWSNRPTLTDCQFVGNVSGRDGGAMWNYQSSPVLVNCLFAGNLAREGGSGSYGGAVWNYGSNPVLTNCLFTGNKARSSHIGSGGGAIWVAYGSVTIINCTFNGNVAEQGGAICGDYEASFSLANCILWNDKPDEIFTRGTTPVMKYCDVQNGSLSEGNITADPCFVAPGHWDSDLWIEGDYHLRSAGWRWDPARAEWTFDRVTSRCIDAGNPGSPLADEPLTIPDDPNNDWGCGLRIDMGAYGGTAEASIPPYNWAILGDLNNDGIVDFCDFACAGLYWALTAPEQPCDLNRNGDVNPADLDLLADDWLKTTIWRK